MIKEFKEFNESKFENGFSIRDEFDKFKLMVNEYASVKLKPVLEFILDIDDLMTIRSEDFEIDFQILNLIIGDVYVDFNIENNTIDIGNRFQKIDDLVSWLEYFEQLESKLNIDIGYYRPSEYGGKWQVRPAEEDIINKFIQELKSRYEYLIIRKNDRGRITLKFRIGDL